MNIFDSVKMTKPNRNQFDLSHDVKLSLNMGELVPIACIDCVPGDKFDISAESLMRFAPMVAPLMHRIDVTMHYFFVPRRILWPNWENFITNTKISGTLPAQPYLTINTGTYSRLHDYLGIPNPIPTFSEDVNAMAMAAYQCIYNEYYRDQNLVDPVDYKLIDGNNGSNAAALNALRLRAWEHDYFTASLPFAQKGDPVNVPMGGLVGLSPGSTGPMLVREAASGHPNVANADIHSNAGAVLADNSTAKQLVIDPNGTLEVTNANSTINDLRRAYRLQEWLEKAARGGSRYIENILMHFGVKSSDKRLQRPEYITGCKSPVVISEVLQTSQTDTSPQGNMAGHAVSVTSGHHGSYFCEEHGYIMGIMSVIPKTAYQQGLPKHFIKTGDPFEYYWPSFANIGEQEVQNREVYAFQGPTAGQDVFGYVPRYAEYKYEPNRVAGDFRTTLDFWQLGRIFSGPPSLNQEFIECVPDPRIFAVTDPDVQHLYAHVYNKIRASRGMPKFGTPTF